MSAKNCENCEKVADIICFCKNLLFCRDCIGDHLILIGDQSHKPVVLNQELTKVFEVSIDRLKKSETSILAEAVKTQNIKISIVSRLMQETEKIDEFFQSSLSDLHAYILNLKQDLDSIQCKIQEKLRSDCTKIQSQIHDWIQSVEQGFLDQNSITAALSKCSSFQEMQTIDFTIHKSKLEEISLESLITLKAQFKIDIKEIPTLQRTLPKLDQQLQKVNAYETPDRKFFIQVKDTSVLSDDKNLDFYDSSLPLRFSTNNISDSLQYPLIYNSTDLSSYSLSEKQRRYTYSKEDFEKPISPPVPKNFSRKFLSSLVWVDNANECILSYCIPSGEISNVFLPNQDQKSAGGVWCLTNEDLLIVTGGNSPATRRQTLTIDPLTGRTFVGNLMHVGRYHHAAVFVGQFLYVMGGSNGVPIKECEKYNISTNTWQKAGNLNVAREYLAACMHRGRIYVAGGEGADSIETYNTVSNKFSLLRVRLPGVSQTFMASVDDQILIFHKKKVISFDSSKMSCVDFCDLNEENWWTPANHIVTEKTVFFIKQGNVMKFDIDKVQINSLANLC